MPMVRVRVSHGAAWRTKRQGERSGLENEAAWRRRRESVADATLQNAYVDHELAACRFRDQRLGKRFRSLLKMGRATTVPEVVAVLGAHDLVAQSSQVEPEMRDLVREERPGVQHLVAVDTSPLIDRRPLDIALRRQRKGRRARGFLARCRYRRGKTPPWSASPRAGTRCRRWTAHTPRPARRMSRKWNQKSL